MDTYPYDYAYNQYYLSIINDREIVSALRLFLSQGEWDSYVQYTSRVMDRLRKRHDLKPITLSERVFVALSVYDYLGLEFHEKVKDHLGFRSHISYAKTNQILDACPNRLLGHLGIKIPTPSIPKPIQKPAMSITFKTITYINGTDVNTLTEDQLIGFIKRTEAEIADLGSIKTKSKKVDQKIADAEATLGKLVAALDVK